MKIFMKKLLLSLIILVLIFNFAFLNPVQAATARICGIGEVVQSIMGVIGSVGDGILGILTYIPKLFALIAEVAIMSLMAVIAGTFGYVDEYGNAVSALSGFLDTGFLTPDDIFFNKLLLTDVNIFKLDLANAPDAIIQLRSNVALWYYIMRMIAISILLAVLLYIAIRMAISTVAQDKAFYKRMLINWASSIALVFVLHYLIIIVLNINSGLVGICSKIYNATSSGAGGNLSDAVGNLLLHTLSISATTGWASIAVVGMIIVQTFAFLIYYIKRVLTIAFLVIISPLITLTYSIDKLGDGKAQALNTWLKEFFFTIIIQPFHCITYMVFMSLALAALGIGQSTGQDIAKMVFSGGLSQLVGGLLAILCMKFVWDGEKIVKNIFGIKVSDNLGDAVASAAIAGTVVSKAVGTAGKAGAQGVKKIAGDGGVKKMFSAEGKLGRLDKKIDKQDKIIKNSKNAEERAKAKREKSRLVNKRDSVKKMADKKKIDREARNILYENGGGNIFGRTIHNGVKKAKEFGEEHPKLKRFMEKASSPAVAAAIMAGAMTYGSSDKRSMFDAGIAGYGAGKVIGSKWDQLKKKKDDNYIDNTKGNMKMFEEQIMGRSVDESDPTKYQEQLSQFAEDSQRMGKEGDYDKMSKEKSKAEDNLEQLLREQGIDENDIQRIVAEIMSQLQNGIFSRNLDMDKIAGSHGLRVEDLRSAVKDFASLKVHQSTYTDNESINEIFGDKEYYKVVLEALALQNGVKKSDDDDGGTPTPTPPHTSDDDDDDDGGTPTPHYADVDWDTVPDEDRGKEFDAMLDRYSKDKDDGKAEPNPELEKIIALLQGLNLRTSDERAEHLQKMFSDPAVANPTIGAVGTAKFSGGITIPEAEVVSTMDAFHRTTGKVTVNEVVEEIKKEKHIEETEVHKLERFVTTIYERELFRTVDKGMKDKSKA